MYVEVERVRVDNIKRAIDCKPKQNIQRVSQFSSELFQNKERFLCLGR